MQLQFFAHSGRLRRPRRFNKQESGGGWVAATCGLVALPVGVAGSEEMNDMDAMDWMDGRAV